MSELRHLSPLAKRLAFFLLKRVNKAIRDYDMIQDGDRVALAVSGGKDSLTLLKLLNLRRRTVPERYELVAVNVQADYQCLGHLPSEELKRLFELEGVEYSIERVSILGEGGQDPDCFWCSWNRRKAIFIAADRLGCNKVAFAHHADDVAQTTLLNLFYHGRLETMEPRVEFFGGRLTLIRPLVYVPEKEIARFAEACGFPSPSRRCPKSVSSKRTRMKELLRAIEKECPQVKTNLLRAAQRGPAGSRKAQKYPHLV